MVRRRCRRHMPNLKEKKRKEKADTFCSNMRLANLEGKIQRTNQTATCCRCRARELGEGRGGGGCTRKEDDE